MTGQGITARRIAKTHINAALYSPIQVIVMKHAAIARKLTIVRIFSLLPIVGPLHTTSIIPSAGILLQLGSIVRNSSIATIRYLSMADSVTSLIKPTMPSIHPMIQTG